MKFIIFIFYIIILLAGCAFNNKYDNKNSLSKVKYAEVVSNNNLIESKLIMLPVWENKIKKIENVKTKARAIKEPNFSINVTLLHNAIKNILINRGEKHVYSKTEKNNNTIKDYIRVEYEGYILSPPVSSEYKYDSINGEAYGTFVIGFSLENK
jgi:hypothetical protein